MDTLQILWLALIQGLTEFLPISSSAHLILVPRVLGWPDQGLAFDVAVHLGTLIAVVAYFRREIVSLFLHWMRSIGLREMTPESRLAWGVILGTIPAGLFGLLAKDFIETSLRSPLVIATTTVVFGLLLWFADSRASLRRDELVDALDGFSDRRCVSGACADPGYLALGHHDHCRSAAGLTREGAARYSFLLSIPIIVLSGLGVTRDLLVDTAPIDWQALLLGTVVAGISAFACITLFLNLINRAGMLPFVIYRLMLGAFLFWLFL